MLEWIAVISILALAAAYLAWRLIRSTRAKRQGAPKKATLTIGGKRPR